MATAKSNPAFKKIRSVTVTLLKLENNQPRYLYVTAPMFMGEKIDAKKDAAILLPVVDMETGEEGNVIAPAILQGELVKTYGGAEYVGKGFEVTKSRDPSVKYNHVSISEVGLPDEFKPPVAPQHSPASIAAAAEHIAANIAAKTETAGGVAAPSGKTKR